MKLKETGTMITWTICLSRYELVMSLIFLTFRGQHVHIWSWPVWTARSRDVYFWVAAAAVRWVLQKGASVSGGVWRKPHMCHHRWTQPRLHRHLCLNWGFFWVFTGLMVGWCHFSFQMVDCCTRLEMADTVNWDWEKKISPTSLNRRCVRGFSSTAFRQ